MSCNKPLQSMFLTRTLLNPPNTSLAGKIQVHTDPHLVQLGGILHMDDLIPVIRVEAPASKSPQSLPFSSQQKISFFRVYNKKTFKLEKFWEAKHLF